MKRTQDIVVTFKMDNYRTNKVYGITGNSTMSAAAAAKRLAEKLYGADLLMFEFLGDDGPNRSRWRIHFKGLLGGAEKPIARQTGPMMAWPFRVEVDPDKPYGGLGLSFTQES